MKIVDFLNSRMVSDRKVVRSGGRFKLQADIDIQKLYNFAKTGSKLDDVRRKITERRGLKAYTS